MTEHEKSVFMSALKEPDLSTFSDCGVTYKCFEYGYLSGLNRGWKVILIPKVTRIYSFPAILQLIERLDLDVVIYTDLHQPGCIIIH